MEFPKGASIPFGQGRGKYPGREVASFIYNVEPKGKMALDSITGILTCR